LVKGAVVAGGSAAMEAWSAKTISNQENDLTDLEGVRGFP
jgi:hypothetical protein